ncbi:ComF family protein [Reyranella sp.]|uniref:ComF family protein n=1 Tax=Reyranella sp. TaxID=1929291 RepID=UPI0025DB0059|nr:ComF family protein [Reyranella sp.]
MLLDAVLPPLCLGCGEIVGEVGGLCASCWQSFNFMSAPHCACCGTPFAEDLGPGALCAGCMARRPRYNRARAALIYDDHSRRLILPFKHGDRTDIARACGGWMARAGAELLASADLVAPVPLHWRRLFTRRYNQAALLARIVVRELIPDIKVRLAPDLLRRGRWTGSQTGLRARERRRNVREAFDIHPHWRTEVAGKRILLIDDVLTTGATVEACSRVLERAGADCVDVLTLARVIRPAV